MRPAEDSDLRPTFRRGEAALLLIAAAFTGAGVALAVVGEPSAVDTTLGISTVSATRCRMPVTVVASGAGDRQAVEIFVGAEHAPVSESGGKR